MSPDREELLPGDRERVLNQMVRTERDLSGRFESDGVQAGNHVVRERLSFLLRKLRGDIGELRDDVAKARDTRASPTSRGSGPLA
jgi:hypothetical protein